MIYGGNEEEGYEVNDIYSYGTFDFDGDLDNDNDILDFLNKEYFATSQHIDAINIDGDDKIIYITSSTGMPICELEVL